MIDHPVLLAGVLCANVALSEWLARRTVLRHLGAALLRLDLDATVVASQAAVGGGTSALALARSLGRADLTASGILMGSLGTALGTYLGFAVAGWLG